MRPGIWRSDPSPVQARPRVPPEAYVTGDQPPRYSTALLVALVLAWPQPTDVQATHLPLAQRRYVVTQTLTYGDAPPLIGPRADRAARWVVTWIPAWMAPPAPYQSAGWDVPLVAAEPPPRTVIPWVVLRAWELVTVAPLTLTYGEAPPLSPPVAAPVWVQDASAARYTVAGRGQSRYDVEDTSAARYGVTQRSVP